MKKTEDIEIYQKVIAVATRNLRQIGCAFKIVDADGNTFEHDVNRVIEPAKAKRQNNKYNYGQVRKTYMPFIKDLQPGDVALVPFDTVVAPIATQSGACAWMSENWGVGTYTTHMNRDKNVVEILRLE